jgi:hypothetical protein
VVAGFGAVLAVREFRVLWLALSLLQLELDPLRSSRSRHNTMITARRVDPKTARNPW